MNASKNAPVPPAEQPDLTKMVEAGLTEIDKVHWPSPRVPFWTAILLRHLQPLAEQVAELNESLLTSEHFKAEADKIAYQHRDAMLAMRRQAEMDTVRFREMQDAGDKAEHEIADLRAQLTAAQEELARAKQERDALRIEYESRSIWIDKMNKILGYDNSDGFHSEPDPFAIATALQSALAQKEKDGERLKKAQRWILNHCDRWEGDHACATCWPEAQRKHEPIITGFICAVCAARTARAEGDKT